eukprot:6924801-Prymnesium_polylepis.1
MIVVVVCDTAVKRGQTRTYSCACGACGDCAVYLDFILARKRRASKIIIPIFPLLRKRLQR